MTYSMVQGVSMATCQIPLSVNGPDPISGSVRRLGLLQLVAVGVAMR